MVSIIKVVQLNNKYRGFCKISVMTIMPRLNAGEAHAGHFSSPEQSGELSQPTLIKKKINFPHI
jgi:hypothetical protein